MAIEKLGLLGAGTMGSGIAIASAQAGLEVILADNSEAQLDRALDTAKTFYDRAVQKGRMEAEAAEAALGRITGSQDMAALAESDLCVEAVFEDFDLKAKIFAQLSELLPDDSLVATNTSCLRVSDLAAHVRNPERFLGLHYFSPAQINPLVEVVRGEATSQATYDAALTFVEATGKKPLACRDSFGFAVNRFFCPYTNEASRLVGEGSATTAQVDRVAREALGVAAGPFLVQNIIKPRINLNAIRNLGPLGAFYQPAPYLITIGDADGSFDIDEDESGFEGKDALIADRLRGATFLPILEELSEEVASPADIDMGAATALRFSPPCQMMDALGRAEVERVIAPLCEAYKVPLPASIEQVGSLRG
ncbi:MAG: 3-hydroxyacyl-CoA dehydrogenase family protein [Pseudomonadota bacterium]